MSFRHNVARISISTAGYIRERTQETTAAFGYLKQRDKFWYKRFRTVAYLSAIGLLILTLLTILPFRPFSYLPPIIAARGPGSRFLLGYAL